MEKSELSREILQDASERAKREQEWHDNNPLGKEARAAMGKYHTTNVIRQEFFKKLVFDKLDHNTVFLDYGCGDGHALFEASPKIKKGVGIDISETRINQAKSTLRENGFTNIEFFVMDAMNTTFENETFDIVRGAAILHHVDFLLSLNEIKRILKKGGYGLFVEPLGTNPILVLGRKLTPKARTDDEQPLRWKEIKLMKKLFPNMKIYYFSFFTIFATPFRNFKFFPKLLKVLFFMDKIILHKWSPFKFLAWGCNIVLRK